VKPLRFLAAGLVWILAGVVGLLGVVLCITVILLPLGIPLVMVARRLYTAAARLMLPRGVRHPVEQVDKSVSGEADKLLKQGRRFVKRTKAHVPGTRPTVAQRLKRASRLSH
jgi:hypothetical protein